MHSPTGRLDNTNLIYLLDSTGSNLIILLQNISSKAKRFYNADISFLNPMMLLYSQIIAGRGLALKISNNVNDLIKAS